MERLRIVVAGPDRRETWPLQRQLERLGHTVVGEAQDDDKALLLVHETNPDLALVVPGPHVCTPVDVADVVHKLIRQHPLPIIIVYNSDPILIQQGPLDDVDGLLVLPIGDGELTWTMRAAIIRFRERDELRRCTVELEAARATKAAIAILNAQLFEASQRQAQELAALYDTALHIGSALETETLLARIYEQVQLLMNPDSFGVFLYHAEVDELEILLAMEANQPVEEATGMRASLEDGGLTGWVIRTQKPLLVGDLEADRLPVKPRHITLPARSWLGVPLIVRDRLIGAISAQSFRPHAFDDGDRRLLESLAAQVAIAIENARLYEAQRQQADDLARLHRASAALFFVTTTDVRSLAQIIVEAVLHEFCQTNCSLFLLDPTTGELERAAAAGPYAVQVTQPHLTMNGPGLVPLALRTHQSVNVPDVLSHPDYVCNWDQARAELAIPLKVGERFIGILDVQSSQPAAFGPSDERLLGAFAERSALALENARLYQEATQRAQEMASLYEIGLATVSSFSLDDVLAAIYEQCRSVLPCETFSIALHCPGERYITFPLFIHRGETVEASPLDFQASEGFTSFIIQQRQPLILDAKSAYRDNVPVRPKLIAAPPADTYLGVPLIYRDEVIGVLAVQSSDPEAYNENHLQLLITIASQAAIAIENTRYYQAAQEYTASLQAAAREKETLLERLQLYAENLEQEVAARTTEIFAEKVRVEAILESAADAIVLIDADNCVSFVNHAFSTLTGFSHEEVVGRSVQEVLFVDQNLSAVTMDIEQVMVQGISWRGDVLVRRKDTCSIEVEMTLAPVRDASGQTHSFVSSLRDVTQARALERAKSEFLTSVSHQLRTPVTNLKTYTYLLDQGSPEKQAHYIDVLSGQVDKLTHLIQDVLEMAELDSGPIVTAWHPVSPTSLVTSVVKRCQTMAEEAGRSISLVIPDEPMPPLLGSAQRLAQALTQIVENALLYTEGEQVVVGARLDLVAESGKQELVLSVADSGPGIPSEEQERLFDRFFRGEAAKSGRIPGTGLGLSIAEMIFKAHHGRIDVRSKLGQGSTFEIRLPVVTQDNDTVPMPSALSVQPQP